MSEKIVADFIGITSYRMSQDRPNCFLSTWYSTRTGEPKVLGTGVARGDTSNGFCGVFEIRYYEPDGEPASRIPRPYELTITRQDEVRNMTWRRDGKTVLVGIGIEIGDQLIASYWRPAQQNV
jgi:hypothetical protein